jgi:acyl dehydratase
MSESVGITRELARGKFTDEMLQNMRNLMGKELRYESCQNADSATRFGILRFCEGIGDGNPLWMDREYAAASPFGRQMAPPSFIFACLASIQVGWPGMGGFHAETKLKFHRRLGVGDGVTPKVFFDGFDGPTEASNFAGRRIKDYVRQEYWNQNGEQIAEFICSRMRFERAEMQAKRESRKIELPHPWTDDQLAQIEADILAETPRGATPRFWDDVNVGDEIDTVTKGPMGLSDFIAFVAAGAAPIPRISAHRVALTNYRKHPAWAFRDPKTNALEPVYSVHYNDYAAQLQGAQIAYDVGIQRTCWQIHTLTNWMGDAGFLKAADSQYRAHVYLSDVLRLGGKVEGKEIDADGDHVVHLTTWANNQRGQNCMPGRATIALPTKAAPGPVRLA